ncbi:MAG TPA: hypothetical protein VF914_20370 [Chloroflexia bacterium]|jgi:hypothetical protein
MDEPVFKYADHWQWALACTVRFLEDVVFTFDFQEHMSRTGKHVCVEITPEKMIEAIDGFLSERETIPASRVTELEELRVRFLDTVTPAYEAGKSVAHQIWVAITSDEERTKLMYTLPEDVIIKAWERVPQGLSSSQASWFVEGFCSTWAQEWFAFQVSKL